MGNAIRARKNDSSQPTTVVENYFTDDTVRAEFQAIIEDIGPRILAKAANCTIDAARLWIAGERTPNTASVFNMARSLPAIGMWLAEHGGYGHEAWIISELKSIAMQEGPEGQFARGILRKAGITRS